MRQAYLDLVGCINVKKTYVYASYAFCLWSLKNCHILLLDFLLKWNVRSCWTMVYRSTVCPTKWAAVVLVLVESSMHFFHLKDQMRWFTPSNNIVSDVYAVYNAYDVLHYIKQPSVCWTSLIMFSGHVSRQKSHVVSVAIFIFVIIHCLCLLVWFKLYFGIY